MSTVKTISKQTLQNLVDEKKSVEEIAEILGAPKSKIKEGLKFFDIKLPRASRGGIIWNFLDEEAEFDVPVAIEAPVIVTEDTTNNNVPLTF